MVETSAGLTAITLVVDDLPAAREFFLRVFDGPLVHEDASSAVLRFGSTLINLLDARAAPELVAPLPVAAPGGARAVLTIAVDDVDAAAAELAAKGVVLLSGPMDRPWGIRTLSFQDPAGHVWELAH